MTVRVRTLPFAHLSRLMGPHGLFEHARYRRPRLSHGYTTDDNARAVVVTQGAPGADAIYGKCLAFVLAGGGEAGWHNRMDAVGRWRDAVGSEDAQGRAIWAMGIAAVASPDAPGLEAALDLATRRDLPPLRSVSYAVLGACPASEGRYSEFGHRVLAGYAARRPRLRPGGEWVWPEERLTYDNARVPEAMIRAGQAMGDRGLVDDGLELLDWLCRIEWVDDRFAFTPVGGRGPGEPGPLFDQQPIEAWAMVDACVAALQADGDRVWQERAVAALDWFAGRNHPGLWVCDPEDGAGFDGLHSDAVNRNAGAESTLALLGAHRTLGHAPSWRPVAT